MGYTLDRDSLFQQSESTLRALTDPIFLENMRQFRALKGPERMAFAQEKMTRESLIEQGAVLPESLRVSSRTFEEGEGGKDQYIDFAKGQLVYKSLVENHPDKIEILREKFPKVFKDFEGFGLNPFPNLRDPFPLPKDPSNPLLDDISPVAAPWGCACGGAASACAGGGGGT